MDESTSLWNYMEADVLERIPDKGGKRLIGEYSSERYWIASERIKRLVRSMRVRVDDVQRQGDCLPKFDHKNWEVTAIGLAVFKGLQLVKKTDELVVQNYDHLHGVIKNTIFRKFTIQEIPPDFKELLYWMKHKPLNNGYLMRNFAALIPLENRLLFFVKAYEHITFYLEATDKEMKKRILKKLPYSTRWFEIVKGNYLLEYSFKYKTRDDSGSPEGFMEFYRDSNFHRMDMCFQIVEVGGYEAKEHELLFLVKYPLYLTTIEECLHDEKQLERLKPHLLFSVDPETLPPMPTNTDSSKTLVYASNSFSVFVYCVLLQHLWHNSLFLIEQVVCSHTNISVIDLCRTR